MKANAYTAFLKTKKIKVFPTVRGIKPFTIPSKCIRYTYPVMLASVMIIEGCSPSKSNTPSSQSEKQFPTQEQKAAPNDSTISMQVSDTIKTNTVEELPLDLQRAYNSAIKKYGLDTLKNKVPFSPQEILDLMKNPNPPSLSDRNYNHRIENLDNFWEIVRNGIHVINTTIQNSDILDDSEKKEYRITAFKMLSQMSKYKEGNEVDITDNNNQKTFCFFEKVLRHKDDYYKVLKTTPGESNEQTEFIGRYYKDFNHLAEVVENYPHINKFIDALYLNDNRYFFTTEDIAQANVISKRIYKQWVKKQQIKDKNLFTFANYEPTDTLLNRMNYNFRRDMDCFTFIEIEQQGKLDDESIAPIWSILIHELQHGGQKEFASNEAPEDNQLYQIEIKRKYKYQDNEYDKYAQNYLAELGPTLSSLARDDQIYKEIHGIEPNAIVDYGVMIDTGAHKIPLGKIATWFWQMEQKYPYNSIDKIIAEPEVLIQLNAWADEKADVDTNYSFKIIQAQQNQK